MWNILVEHQNRLYEGLATKQELNSLSKMVNNIKSYPAKSAGNLGVIFDKNFTFCSHISAVGSSCFYHMRDPARIHCYLGLDSAKLLATALAFSRLDYCNSLLYGVADIDLTRLPCAESTGPLGDKVSSIYLQCSTASFTSLVASKV